MIQEWLQKIIYIYINSSRLELQKRSFSRVGTLINLELDSIDLNLRLRSSRKQTFKSKIHQALLTILKDQNDYVDVPMIISEMLLNIIFSLS
jgi:hypothetical protein